MPKQPTKSRTGFYCQLPKKTVKRIAALARSYKLPQWAIVEQGVKMVKAKVREEFRTVKFKSIRTYPQNSAKLWSQFKGPKSSRK